MELANVIGSGEINSEIDLQALENDLCFSTCYIKGPGLYFKFEESGPTVVVARSGKYFFTGANSIAEIERTRELLLNLFLDLGLIDEAEDENFSVKNMVFTADMDRSVDLHSLLMRLGIESIEYEPEQFPGLIYRPEEHDCILLVFASGKVVITGAKRKRDAKIAFEQLVDIAS